MSRTHETGRVPMLTDDLIRLALTPSPDLAAPSGLAATIGADVRRTPQHRPLIRWPWASDLGTPRFDVRGRPLAWALAGALLAAGLVGAALVGSQVLRPSPDLRTTDVETLTPESTGYDRVLVDGKGTSWAVGPGHVTRFDPATGERETWTLSDAPALAGSWMATPAAAGGIWLPDGDTFARFEGADVRERFEMPVVGAEAARLVEGSDGSAATVAGGRLWFREGSAWVAAADGRELDEPHVVSLLVLGPGEAWVVDTAGVSHLAAGTWTTWTQDDVLPLAPDWGWELLAGPDGSVWLSSSSGIARYAGGTWSEVEAPGFPTYSVAIDGDGAVWALGSSGSPESTPHVASLRGGTWTELDGGAPADGRLSTTDAGFYLAVRAGPPYRLVDGRWEPLWNDPIAGPSVGSLMTSSIEASSAEEAWVIDDGTVWHFVDGRWVDLGEPFPGGYLRGIVEGPGGEPIVSGSSGVAVRQDGRWTTIWQGDMGSLAAAPDGSIWVAAGLVIARHPVVRLHEVDGEWRSSTVDCPVGGWDVAVGSDGAVWTSGIDYSGTGGLARFDGSTCSAVDPMGADRRRDVLALAAGPDGTLAAIVKGDVVGPRDWKVMRFDGATWSVIRDLPFLGWSPDVLAIDGAGAIWSGSGKGLERFDGTAWRTVEEGISATSLAFAPDGTLWFVGPAGVQRLRAEDIPDR